MSAGLFGIVLLAAILVTAVVWPADAPLARYDALFLVALATQGALLAFGLETWREARVIAVFHLVATAMEWFKTSMGSWSYPEPAVFSLWGVPWFAGFMYSAVGSFLARGRRLFRVELEGRPSGRVAALLAVAAYGNFFTHHWWMDIRGLVLVGIVLAFATTWVRTTIGGRVWRLPFLLALGAVALLIWGAENVATFGGAWLYPGQVDGWHWVSWHKIPAWFLMGFVSFVLVSTTVPRESPDTAIVVAPQAVTTGFTELVGSAARSRRDRFDPASPSRRPRVLRLRSGNDRVLPDQGCDRGGRGGAHPR